MNDTLTAMTYNLRFGGGGRLSSIADVIAAHRPDVLAAQELGRRRDPEGERPGGSLRRLGALLGARGHAMRGYAGRSTPALGPPWPGGQPVGVLVRAGIRVLSAGPVPGWFRHGAVRVVLDTDPGPLTVLSAHLCPYSGRCRLREARRLATLAQPARPVLLLGDLNALDPAADPADLAAALDRLPRRHRVRHLRADGRVDTRAVAALTGAGFVDLCGAHWSGPGGPVGATVPTGYAGAEFPRTRLDYALGTPPVARAALACRVVVDGAARTASDHYPLAVDLSMRARGLST